MNHTDPTRRHEFVLLFDVKDGNPNGDPDAGNLPRIDPENNCGLVTDVCIKRKVRDYVAGVLGRPIFIQSETALNTLMYQAAREIGVEVVQITVEDETVTEWLRDHKAEDLELDGNILRFTGEKYNQKVVSKELFRDIPDHDNDLRKKVAKVVRQLEEAAKGKKTGREERANIRAKLIEKYYDIRMFGAVLSTGPNAGQVRGPVQLTFARSVDPIFPMDCQITRVAITQEEARARKETEMGRKPIVPYGLYRAHGFFNPYLAEKTKVSEQDLKDLWEALEKMFEFDRSAARGEMAVRGLYVFTHDNKKGNAPAHKILDLIKVSPCGKENAPRDFGDYAGKISAPSDGPIATFPGVTLKAIVRHDV